ncbi:MAG: ribosome maturation factor RimM [Lachnospiraceae bacterium]|jgi:16S rRNA processing protein RimM|nr:ribosome maturation factor RimM [Lachnospiraceae bacterium]
MEDRFQVGIITAPHGVKGEVKVFPTTDDVRRFKRLKKVIVDMSIGDSFDSPAGKDLILAIENVKFFKQFAILKLSGVDSMDDALKYKGKSLWVERSDAVRLGKGEYFIADLIGLLVVNEDERPLGRLTDVLQTGANDVYTVLMEDGREVLIPAIKECILEVDMPGQTMKVHLLDGLLD